MIANTNTSNSKCTWVLKVPKVKVQTIWKIADLQAHNVSGCDTLWACGFKLFWDTNTNRIE